MKQSARSDPAAPLRGHRLFRSTELDEARDFVARKFCRHRLERRNSSDRFDACQHHAAGVGMSVNYIRYGAEVEIEPGELGSFYLIQIPVKGKAWVKNGSQEVCATFSTPSVLNPNRHTTMRWYEGCEKLLLQVDRETLQKAAEDLVGHCLPGPVVFHPQIEFRRPAMRRWWQRIKTVVQAAEDGRLFSSNEGLSQRLVEEELIEAFLLHQPSNVSHYLEASPPGLAPAHVKRAQRFIHEKLRLPLTIGEIASAAGVTPRSLQLGFRAACGMTPLQYLRCERLFGAHYDLMRAEPGMTVANVAYDWGFTHLGRFSQDYRQAFGVSPRDRLKHP
jgi:AraC-like DNA-binding protein